MFNKKISFNTPVTDLQRGFQDPASPVAEGISAFHNDLRVLVRFILRFVVYVLSYSLSVFAKDVSDSTGTQNLQHVVGKQLSLKT